MSFDLMTLAFSRNSRICARVSSGCATAWGCAWAWTGTRWGTSRSPTTNRSGIANRARVTDPVLPIYLDVLESRVPTRNYVTDLGRVRRGCRSLWEPLQTDKRPLGALLPEVYGDRFRPRFRAVGGADLALDESRRRQIGNSEGAPGALGRANRTALTGVIVERGPGGTIAFRRRRDAHIDRRVGEHQLIGTDHRIHHRGHRRQEGLQEDRKSTRLNS